MSEKYTVFNCLSFKLTGWSMQELAQQNANYLVETCHRRSSDHGRKNLKFELQKLRPNLEGEHLTVCWDPEILVPHRSKWMPLATQARHANPRDDCMCSLQCG